MTRGARPRAWLRNRRLRQWGGREHPLRESSDACTDTIALVTGADEVVNGAPAESYANVFILKYDSCNQIVLTEVYFNDAILPEAFHVDQNGLTAILKLKVEGYDNVTESTIPIEVRISWSASGSFENHNRVDTIQRPGAPRINRSRGKARDAIATGVISVGGATLLSKSSDFASISARAEVNIYHYN
jgi:hypothetical protein